jgi:uracil-DNA glycosylase
MTDAKQIERQYINVTAMFDGVHPSWIKLLKSDAILPHLITVLDALDPLCISPKADDILTWAKFRPVNDISVVIIGQDPYPDPSHAHGLCFSSRAQVLPESFKYIYDCLQEHKLMNPLDSTIAMPAYLGAWAAQGVLMINTALTTRPGERKSHASIWEPVTREIIKAIGAMDQPIIWFLWGNDAKKMRPHILSTRHQVLEEIHPSPMAQVRLPVERQFRHCNHFIMANQFMQANKLRLIDWDPHSRHIVYTDGSANNTGTSGRAGYAAYFTAGPLKSTKLWGRLAPVSAKNATDQPVVLFPTNIRAEGWAIMLPLEQILATESSHHMPNVEIVTDSKFWIDMIESWIPRWVKQKIPFEAHENPDITARIHTLIVKFGPRLKLRHIYSHGKDKTIAPLDRKYNDLCDAWANKGRESETFHESRDIYYD